MFVVSHVLQKSCEVAWEVIQDAVQYTGKNNLCWLLQKMLFQGISLPCSTPHAGTSRLKNMLTS